MHDDTRMDIVDLAMAPAMSASPALFCGLGYGLRQSETRWLPR
jgi:hypothetical protein